MLVSAGVVAAIRIFDLDDARTEIGKRLRASRAGNHPREIDDQQAIEGAARYVNYILTTYATNGVVPDPTAYQREAVSVGSGRFWLIGRSDQQTVPGELAPTRQHEGMDIERLGDIHDPSSWSIRQSDGRALHLKRVESGVATDVQNRSPVQIKGNFVADVPPLDVGKVP